MGTEPRRKQRSNACLWFTIIGCALIVASLFLIHRVVVWLCLIPLLVGIGLCIACLVYAVLCRRICELTGNGIAGVIIAMFGMGFGLAISIILIMIEIFFPYLL